MTILAIDHSLCHTGAVFFKDHDKVLQCNYASRKQTPQTKHAVWVEIFHHADYLYMLYQPKTVVLEMPNVVRSEAAGASKFSVYALAAYFEKKGCDIHYVSAKRAKAAFGLTITAPKQAMLAKAFELHPEMNWYTRNGKLTLSKNNHIADALAVLYAYQKAV